MVNVAFVCLGNICRSPMAEAVFAHHVKQAGLDKDIFVDSFGTSAFHIGESPDSRSASTCRKHGVPVNHAAQQISPRHFGDFDYIIAMDRSNLDNLQRMAPKNSRAKVKLFGDYAGDSGFDRVVKDPYYGGNQGFENNFKQVNAFSGNLLDEIKSKNLKI